MAWLLFFGVTGSFDGSGALVILGLALDGFVIWCTVKFIQPLIYILFGGAAGSAKSQYGYQRHVKPEDLDFVA